MTTTSSAHAIGVDVGGTGIKGAPVDLDAGAFTAERIRIPTPQPATPDAVAAVVKEIVTQLDAPGTIGLTLPSVVRDGVAHTASNIDHSWIGTDAAELFREATGRAGRRGERRRRRGHRRDALRCREDDPASCSSSRSARASAARCSSTARWCRTPSSATCPSTTATAEEWAAESVREDDDLSWKEWGHRLSDYMQLVEKLLWPDLIIIGGGVSRKSEKFLPHVRARTEIVPAQLLNDAGIVGAALFAPTA